MVYARPRGRRYEDEYPIDEFVLGVITGGDFDSAKENRKGLNSARDKSLEPKRLQAHAVPPWKGSYKEDQYYSAVRGSNQSVNCVIGRVVQQRKCK